MFTQNTVFLLSSAKEHWDRTGDAKEAMVGGRAGRIGSYRRCGSVTPDGTGPLGSPSVQGKPDGAERRSASR